MMEDAIKTGHDATMATYAPQQASWGMQAPTEEDIHLVYPHAWEGYTQALMAHWKLIEAAGINTPLRWSHFLAQCMHETGGLTIVRENTGWTAEQMCQLWPTRFKTRLDPRILACRRDPQALANLAYSHRSDIGNLGGDDGWDYRGGGFLQLTGRAAFREAGAALGYDLEANPEAIEDPAISLRCALWVWERHQLGQFADHNYGRTVSNAINRGNPFSKYDPIGHKDRERWFRKVWAVFHGGQSLPNEAELYLGAYGPKVARVQGQLKELGYQLGAEDGVYGPTMARAVAAFKRDQVQGVGVELEAGDVIGGHTLAALDTAQPIALSPERRNITMQGLLDEGSTEMRAGQHMQNVGRGLTLTGLGLGAERAGLFDQAAQAMQSFTSMQYTMVPALKALQWALSHLFWVAVILGGVYCWRSGWGVKAARWTAHKLGFNLSR